jgi:hypothetical protein
MDQSAVRELARLIAGQVVPEADEFDSASDAWFADPNRTAALGKRAGDGFVDLITRIRQNGKTTEAEISVDGARAARLIVTGNLPDEARLALLDLDVTAEGLRGRELRWDAATGEWRPSEELPAAPDENAHTD